MRVESTRPAATLGQQEASFLALSEALSSLIALVQRDTLIHVNAAGCSLLGRAMARAGGR